MLKKYNIKVEIFVSEKQIFNLNLSKKYECNKMRMTILLIALAILLIITISLICINKYDENITQIGIKILVVSILTAFILIYFEILSPLPVDNKTVNVLILQNGENFGVRDFTSRLLKVGSFHKKGYELLNSVNLFFPKNDKVKIDPETKSLDLLEMTFWLWLANKYHLHWDVEHEYFEGISGWLSTTNKSKNYEKKPKEITPEKLQQYLHDNIYSVHKGQLWGIMLPAGTSLNIIERDNYKRTFMITNKHINFKIDIYQMGTSNLEYTTLGKNIKKTLKAPDSWCSDNFKVKFECTYNKWFRGSKMTIKQKKWVNQIMNDFYNDFEWKIIKPDLEKAYNEDLN